jgi:hypothetical protein
MPDLGNSQQPAAEQKASTELPEWAKPYAKDILAKGQALTDVTQNPYQQYDQARIAGFSPMQQQAMQNAQGMSVSPQTGEATAGATMAGIGGLGVAGQANQYGFQNQVGGYMNPYLQMSLAPQLAEANRAYDIGATKQQSAATQAGAFGGSREALMAAENERNRNTGLNQIIGQGYNTAFTNAQQQYNQNLQNQLAGFGLMNQASSNLGQLGQNQYGQEMGINQLQAGYGAQQQAQAQKGLDTAYQDFTNQQNYPYKQLGFMSDMIRGLPLGQQSTTQMYQAPPTGLQTAGSLALTGYGINQLAKGANGGSVYGYADGGEIKTYAGDKNSVTSSDNIEDIISRLNPQQLQAAMQNAQARGDKQTMMLIAQQLEKLNLQAAADKSMSQGIAGAMPQEMADGVVSAAGGGILAFKENGLTPRTALSESDTELTEEAADETPYYGTAPAELLARASRSSAALSKINPTQLTAEEKDDAIKRRYNLEKSLAGPDTATQEYLGMIDKGDTDREGMRNQGKGLAALAAAAGLVQGNNLARGIGQASGAFAQAYAPVIQADRKEKMALANMKFNLMDAQRKERMGMTKSAIAAAAEATKDQQAADKFALDKGRYQAEIDARIAAAGRPVRAGSGAGGPKPEKVWERYATETTNLNALARKLGPDFATKPEYIAKKQDVDALGVIAQQSKDVQPVKAGQTDTAQADKRTAAEAAAWSQTYKGRQAQKAYAIANGIKTGTANPSWREEAREHHRKNFGKTAPAGGSTVINFDANGQPIQ